MCCRAKRLAISYGLQQTACKPTSMKSILTLFFVVPLLPVGCVMDRKWSISLHNTSNHAISFYAGSPAVGHVYPDTTLAAALVPMQQILSNKYGSWEIGYSFEKFFQELPKDTLSLFLFHPDTISKYDWNTIRSQYKVLRRYDLSLQDLQQKNYTVTYP